MIIVALIIIGLAFGSFVNALVWRLHEQLDKDGNTKKLSKKRATELSITKGRSMCPRCGHQLAAADLVPVFSWLYLRGKCRYCHTPISPQYPLVELLVAMLFVVSYVFWPGNLSNAWQWIMFVNWLIALVGLVALAIYDIKWMLLPNKVLKPLALITAAVTLLTFAFGRPLHDLLQIVLSVLLAGGLFWVLFQVSSGKWIGGGDVKLGLYIGLLLASPGLSMVYLLASSFLGTFFVLPLLLSRRVSKDSKIPFGPFLMAGAFIAMLWGAQIISWYTATFINM